MITEKIISIFTAPVLGLLGLLPDVSSDFMNGWSYVKEILTSIFTGIGCFIPLASLAPLFYAVILLHTFRLVLAVVVRIKSFIPLLGGT